MIPEWLLDNWKGVMIRIENEVFTGLNYSVPGWECLHCGGKIGATGLPPRTCFHCNHSSTPTAIDDSEYGAMPIAGDMVATKMICKECGKKKWSGQSSEAYRGICNECQYKTQSSNTKANQDG